MSPAGEASEDVLNSQAATKSEGLNIGHVEVEKKLNSQPPKRKIVGFETGVPGSDPSNCWLVRGSPTSQEWNTPVSQKECSPKWQGYPSALGILVWGSLDPALVHSTLPTLTRCTQVSHKRRMNSWLPRCSSVPLMGPQPG